MPILTEEQRKEMDFPFIGFPKKQNAETWAEWEARCRVQKFDTSKIRYADVAEGDLGIYRDPKVREISDRLRTLDPEVRNIIHASDEINPFDWVEHYKKLGIPGFDD